MFIWTKTRGHRREVPVGRRPSRDGRSGRRGEPPEEEPEYWEDDELTPQELTAWADAMEAASVIPAPAAQPDGGVPDLVGAVLDAGGDPALMTDGDLLTSLADWHAVASRAVARELRATEELLRRRRPRVWDRRADRAETTREDLDGGADEQGPDRVMPAVVASREAAAEVALALTATEYSAQAQVELTADLSRRLPAAFAELDAGRADLHRLRVLAEGTQFLSDEDAARGCAAGIAAGRVDDRGLEGKGAAGGDRDRPGGGGPAGGARGAQGPVQRVRQCGPDRDGGGGADARAPGRGGQGPGQRDRPGGEGRRDDRPAAAAGSQDRHRPAARYPPGHPPATRRRPVGPGR